MKHRFSTQFLVLGSALFTMTLTPTQAAESFLECMNSPFYLKGAIRLVVDSDLLSADEAFDLYSDFSFWIGFDVHSHIPQIGYHHGFDPNGQEIIREFRIIDGINRHLARATDSQTGMISLDWIESIDTQLDVLRRDYPAIIKIECVPPAPGPGTRVGG